MVTLADSPIRCQLMCFSLLCFTFAIGALGEPPPKHHNDANAASAKAIRHDLAFRTGCMNGYRQGTNDSAALSNSYKDDSGAVYSEALDGYSLQYGNQEQYKMLFRRGYIEGYKAGWDFDSGQ